MLLRYRVLNQVYRYSRLQVPQNEADKKALMELVVSAVRKARAMSRTGNPVPIARYVLMRACETGLIQPSDLTEKGEIVLQLAMKQPKLVNKMLCGTTNTC